MNSVVRVTVEECTETYNGTSKATGDPFVIGTWKLKGVLDGKVFIGKAFTSVHGLLTNAKGLIVDVDVTLEAKEYNGRWYNELTVTKVLVDNGSSVNDVPGEINQRDPVEPPTAYGAPVNSSSHAPIPAFNGGSVEDGGLPF